MLLAGSAAAVSGWEGLRLHGLKRPAPIAAPVLVLTGAGRSRQVGPVPLVDASGRVVYVVDVLWRELRAALEIDSREYHFSVVEWQSTMRRHNRLTSVALSVMLFPPARLMGRDSSWLAETAQWLRARAAELAVPYRPGPQHRRANGAEPAPY